MNEGCQLKSRDVLELIGRQAEQDLLQTLRPERTEEFGFMYQLNKLFTLSTWHIYFSRISEWCWKITTATIETMGVTNRFYKG